MTYDVKLTGIDCDFLEVIKTLLKIYPHSTIKVKKNSLDEAINEFKNGDVIRCEDFADYQKKMRE